MDMGQPAGHDNGGGLEDHADPFAILGLARAFNISRADLRGALLRCAVKCHPDRLVDPVQRALAQHRMALATAAAAELSEPEARARALLRLADPVLERQPSEVDPSFLAEVLELREEPNQEQALTKVRQMESVVAEETGTLFLPGGSALDSVEARRKLRRLLDRWRYLNRMIAQFTGRAERA